MNELKVEHSVFINLPAREIFAFMSNLENLVDWSGVVISARKISSEEMLIGTIVRCTIRILGKWLEITFEIIECVPNHFLTFKSIAGIAPSFTSYRFDPVESGGTNVSVEEIIHFTGGFLGFAETVITSIIYRQLSHDLLTLKDILESTASNCGNTR
ncbi:MAG TPA: SRPBCC family protein [Ktedonobacteraceae bacterium]|nr:SRPBCC family protein [Ktedonobacteraceae bacterium]